MSIIVNVKMLKISSLFFIILLHGRLHLKASAGCGLDIDNIKKLRIEAIRGQILSKLRLNQVPSNNQSVPSDLHNSNIKEMYIQTRDFLLEQAHINEREHKEPEENYFARDIRIITTSNRKKDKQPGKALSFSKIKQMDLKVVIELDFFNVVYVW